jgi:hypothetical protein
LTICKNNQLILKGKLSSLLFLHPFTRKPWYVSNSPNRNSGTARLTCLGFFSIKIYDNAIFMLPTLAMKIALFAPHPYDGLNK